MGFITDITNDAPPLLPLGDTLVTFSASDNANNVGEASTTITITDQTAPVITLNGDNSVTVGLNGIYVEQFATAIDNVDGDISGNVTITGNVDTTTIGLYTLMYDVTDLAGNVANTVIRTVSVQDVLAPVITAPNSIEVAAIDANGTLATDANIIAFLQSATALDDEDGVLLVTNDAPSLFPLGDTVVTFSATDLSNNTGQGQSTVTVSDQTVPIINLNGANAIILLVGSTYNELGAIATDNVDGDISNNVIITGAVNTDAEGIFTLNYNVNDSAGNAAMTVMRQVQVVAQDTVEPVVTPPPMLSAAATDANGIASTEQVIIDFLNGATAVDDIDGVITEITNDAPNIFPLNQATAVTFSAMDESGKYWFCRSNCYCD